MINFIAHDDITSSRYLKGNLAKKANGEYTLLSFNRRSLLKQQSSIAVLQSAGVLSNSESKILEFLTPKDNELPILSQSDPIATSLRDSPIEQSSSPPSIIAPHTYSSTSVISGVTTVTDVNPLVEDTPKESKKSTILPNLGIFGSASAPSSQNEDLSDLGSLYSLSEDNRPARKTFFSTKSQNVQTNRMTFSHENPISLNVENSEKVLSKSQSLGPDASNSQKTSNSRSSFSKSSPKNTIASSYSSSSVGAENASRFLRRCSVMNPEGRLSGFKPDVDDIPRESDDSSSVSSHRYSGRSSRRGSASSVLAQQTAQFRQRLSEQTNSLEEEAGNEDSVK